MGKFNRSANLVNFKYSLLSALKEKKWKLFISIIISVIAIFTGVFIAIKYNNSERLASLQEISLDKFLWFCRLIFGVLFAHYLTLHKFRFAVCLFVQSAFISACAGAVCVSRLPLWA